MLPFESKKRLGMTFVKSAFIIFYTFVFWLINGVYFTKLNYVQTFNGFYIFVAFHLFFLITSMIHVRIETAHDIPTTMLYPMEDRIYPREHISPYFFLATQKKSSMLYPTCYICEKWMPPRAQHCYYCNKCNLRFYNHDMMLGKCIAHHNLKFYLLFFLYGSITYSIVALISFLAAIEYFKEIFFTIIFVLVGVFSSSMVVLFVYRIYKIFLGMLRNETPLEADLLDSKIRGTSLKNKIFHRGIMHRIRAKKPRYLLNPYNITWKVNLFEMMGNNVFLWFTAIYTTKGSGLTFDITGITLLAQNHFVYRRKYTSSSFDSEDKGFYSLPRPFRY